MRTLFDKQTCALVTLHFGPTGSGEYVAVRGNILFCYLEKRRDVGKEAGESEGTSLSMAFNNRSVWIISRRTLKDIHVRPSYRFSSPLVQLLSACSTQYFFGELFRF